MSATSTTTPAEPIAGYFCSATSAPLHKHFLPGWAYRKDIEYLEVGADLAFRGGGFAKVLQKFCKSQTTKKGPPFGEPF